MDPGPSENELRFQPAVAVLVLFASGIIVDRFISFHWMLTLSVAVFAFLVWWLAGNRLGRGLMIVALVVGIVASGAFWHHGRWNWFAMHEIAAFCDERPTPVALRGRILGEPRHAMKAEDSIFDPMPKNHRTIFRFEPEAIRNGDRWESVAGYSTLLVHEDVEGIDFGDRVQVTGKLMAIRKPTSPGQFDFQEFNRAKGQLTSVHAMYGDSIQVLEKANRFSNAATLSSLRRWLDELIWRHVDAQQAGFASAILLGNREQLNFDQRQRFLVTGTAHLLAISGLHVGILASVFLFLYRVGILHRRSALLMTIGFVFFYSWLVEFRPPVVRASVLLVLFCLGRLLGRRGNEFNLVALAGMAVLIINPADLFQLGPQLSFLAFATLVVFKGWLFPELSQDPLDRLIRNTRPLPVRWANKFFGGVGKMVLVSALIWFIGLPLVASRFHLVTPSALVVNPIVIVPMAIGLFAGLGVCVFGGPLPWLADGCGWLCGKSLGLVTATVHWTSDVPGAYWWTAGPTILSLFIFYLLLILAVVLVRQQKEIKIVGGWCLLIMMVWLLPFQLDKFSERLEIENSNLNCTFVDVGHGSCVLLELPGGKTMLYDGGSLTSARYASSTIANLLWSKRIEHLDAIVISHADLDHFNAIPDLIQRFSIGVVYVGYPMSEKHGESESVGRLFDLLDEANIPVRMLAWNDRVALSSDSRMTVLMPPEFGTGDSDNSNSIVLKIETGEHTMLLPGDLERQGMQLLLRESPVDCDVVMMPHHGSKNSRPEEFLAWATPQTAIVCASYSKLDRRVINQIKQADCQPLTTAEMGSVQVQFSVDSITISNWADGWQTVSDSKPEP